LTFPRNSATLAASKKVLVLFVVLAAAVWPSGHLRAADDQEYYNAEAAKLKNPVPRNVESIEAGRKLYQRHCASCHGRGGKGDGGLALSGGEPSDLTDDVWDYGSTDGEIFVAIRDGLSADMLAYKEKMKEKEIWQVVNFVRSLGPKQGKE